MATKKPNQKLGQTLQDLEAAFADWETLSDSPAAPLIAPKISAAAAAKDLELRKKTKKLLDQRREQLAALDD